MKKFSKLKSFFKNPIKKNPAEEFVKYFDDQFCPKLHSLAEPLGVRRVILFILYLLHV